jgi:anti-sigma factor RsiW
LKSMNQEQQLKLQAYADGELPPAEAREIEERLEKDAEACACVQWNQSIRRTLRGAELERKLPESRPFFWSKIEREITRAPMAKSEPAQVSWLARLRWFSNPAGAAALVLLVIVVAMISFREGRWGGPGSESAMSDPGALTYIDYRTRTTLVWLTYPASSDYE